MKSNHTSLFFTGPFFTGRIVTALILCSALFLLSSCAKKEPAPQPAPAADTAASAHAPAAKKESKPATVAEIQAKLIEHGAKLKADGKMGAKTKAALKKFQEKNGLRATGIADRSTLAKLGL